ncbi:unnamed protein product, partial [Pylaiella littoralis]
PSTSAEDQLLLDQIAAVEREQAEANSAAASIASDTEHHQLEEQVRAAEQQEHHLQAQARDLAKTTRLRLAAEAEAATAAENAAKEAKTRELRQRLARLQRANAIKH